MVPQRISWNRYSRPQPDASERRINGLYAARYRHIPGDAATVYELRRRWPVTFSHGGAEVFRWSLELHE